MTDANAEPAVVGLTGLSKLKAGVVDLAGLKVSSEAVEIVIRKKHSVPPGLIEGLARSYGCA